MSIDEKRVRIFYQYSIELYQYIRFFRNGKRTHCGVNASGRFSYPPRMAVVLISNKFFVRKIDAIRPEQDAVTAQV